MTTDQSQFPSKLRKASHLVTKLLQEKLHTAKRAFGLTLAPRLIAHLKALTRDFGFSVAAGELQIINGNWYVTHTGLLRLARRKRCRGIHVEAVDSLCDSAANRFVFKATVYPSKDAGGFVGYGDVDPTNVSPLVRGAEMRIAETRAAECVLLRLLGPVGLWFALHVGPPQVINVLPELRQSALKEELNLLIGRAVLPFREFFDSRFKAGSYSDENGDSRFVHFQITKNFSC
jgi:hypothetical protein